MDTVGWIKLVINNAVKEKLGEEPHGIIVLSRIKMPMFPSLPIPIRASVKIKNETLVISVNVYLDKSYGSFRVNK